MLVSIQHSKVTSMYVRIVVGIGNYTTKYVLPFVIDGHSALVRQPKQCLKRGELHPRGLGPHHFVPPTTHLFRGGHAVVCQTHQERIQNASKYTSKNNTRVNMGQTSKYIHTCSCQPSCQNTAVASNTKRQPLSNSQKEVPFQLSNHLPP